MQDWRSTPLEWL